MTKKTLPAALLPILASCLLASASCSSCSTSSSSVANTASEDSGVDLSDYVEALPDTTWSEKDKPMRASRSFDAPFTSIDVSTGLKVRYIQGSPAGMTIEGVHQDVHAIKSYIKKGTLHITRHTAKRSGLKGLIRPHQLSGDVQITVTAPDVSSFDCSTGSILTIDSINNYRKVDIEIGTGGVLKASYIKSPALDLDCSTGAVAGIDRLVTEAASIDASTGATITLSGTATNASMDASTGAIINAGDLICDAVSIDASVGASVTFNAARATTSTSIGATLRNLHRP